MDTCFWTYLVPMHMLGKVLTSILIRRQSYMPPSVLGMPSQATLSPTLGGGPTTTGLT